jgi:predicted nucleic acid-binding protein
MLDLLGKRMPFYDSIAKVATLADNGQITIVASALSYATVSYLLTKYDDAEKAKNKLKKFRIISEICDLDAQIIEKGLNSNFTDFEDSLQYFSALKSDCDLLITRNGKDFKESQIPVMTAGEYLASIRKK